MKIHRFCLQNIDLSDLQENTEIEIKDKEIIHQMKDVFRFSSGDILNIFDGESVELNCQILELHKNNLILKVISKLNEKDLLIQNKNITLAFAILKNDHTELVLEKCTELGVTNFQPLITDRTVKTGLREDRLNKIIKEAAEQSGFIKLPTLHSQIKLSDFMQNNINKNNQENIFILDMYGENLNDFLKNNSDISKDKPNVDSEKIIIIGPEGGWSDAERDYFKINNLKTFSLCRQTLRAETACITTVSKFI